MLSCFSNTNGYKLSNTCNEMFLLVKALTVSNVKNLREEEHKFFSEKPDDVILAECYAKDKVKTIMPHSYPLNFKLLQKEE